MSSAPSDHEARQRPKTAAEVAGLSGGMPPPRRRTRPPTLVWALLGALVIALFVLLLGRLSPYL